MLSTEYHRFGYSEDLTQISAFLIFAYADMSPDLVDASFSPGATGIGSAGVGNGKMSKASVDAPARAVKKEVVVVRSRSVAIGTVGRNVELDSVLDDPHERLRPVFLDSYLAGTGALACTRECALDL